MNLITPAELGRMGGTKTSKLYGPEHYRNMQKKGVETKLKRKLALKLPIDKR
jgi:hypothetical protein